MGVGTTVPHATFVGTMASDPGCGGRATAAAAGGLAHEGSAAARAVWLWPAGSSTGRRTVREAPIVVGVDGSQAATVAADWAAAWAERVRRPLRLLAAGVGGERGSRRGSRGGEVGGGRRAAQEQVTALFVRATAGVLEAHPDLRVDCVYEPADASAALIEASREAAAVVVGSRGLGGWQELRVGSVARDVSSYARSVVTVVPQQTHRIGAGPVVVGVDGSPESGEAAEFAADSAAALGRDLLVVTVCRDETSAARCSTADSIAAELARAPVRVECTTGAGALSAGHEQRRPHEPRVAASVVVGAPALALAAVAPDPSLLVVASRGTGGFAGKLLGSTSQALLELGPCPVAIVRTG